MLAEIPKRRSRVKPPIGISRSSLAFHQLHGQEVHDVLANHLRFFD
jgi:hypothetical protein